MKLPNIIFFDYGLTLLCEPQYSTLRGTEEVMRYVVKNPNDITAQQIDSFAKQLYSRIYENQPRNDFTEVPSKYFKRLLYEYFLIELSISEDELEQIFFEACSQGATMPHVIEMLDYLYLSGIRTAVVSNFKASEYILKRRIDTLLPNNKFEFIIASSSYGVRKPSPILLELALQKAGTKPHDAWYCGDSVLTDIIPASNIGMFPVWYTGKFFREDLGNTKEDLSPNCKHLHIDDWLDIIRVLENCL